MSIPNLITLARLLVVPLIINFMLDERYDYAFWFCMAAGVSDAIDGFIAKRFNRVTTLGAYLDPLADKVLLVSVFVTLGMQGHIQGWLVILIVSRDLLIVGAVVLSYLIDHPVTIRPVMISKANTFAQISLAALLIANLGLAVVHGIDEFLAILSYIVAVTTVLSGGTYLYQWVKLVAAWESSHDQT